MNNGLVALLGVISFSQIFCASFACSPPKGWTPLSDSKRAQKAKLVVYGTVVQSPHDGQKVKGNRRLTWRHYKAQFKLHCVFKGPKLPQYVNVSGFGYVPGLCTNSKAYLNRTYVAFLKSSDSSPGEFRVDEINIQRGTIEVKSKAKLRDIIRSVGEHSLVPIGATTRSEPACLKLRQCTELYRKIKARPPRRNQKKRKCNGRTRAPRNTRVPETISLPPTFTLQVTNEFHFGDFVADTTGQLEAMVGESMNSRAASSFPMYWSLMLNFHCLIFVLIMWQQT